MPREKVTVLSCISHDHSLLPHFIAYYLSLGVDTFILAVTPERLEEVRSICGDWPVRLVTYSKDPAVTKIDGLDSEVLRASYVTEGWVIPADLDEFYQFPEPIEALMQLGFCKGNFVDRIHREGLLAEIKPDDNIWDQYSLECDISALLVKGACNKVVFSRWDVPLSSGHHYCRDSSKQCYLQNIKVHHFKWRYGLENVLKQRIERYRLAKIPWAEESERVIQYLEAHGGRIDPSDFNSRPGWKPRPQGDYPTPGTIALAHPSKALINP